MAAIIPPQRPHHALPYLLVVTKILPFVLAISALGAVVGLSFHVWTASPAVA